LGLAICKQLVDIMGGEIWVESSGVTGEGSDFKFTLPIQLIKDVPLGEHLRDVHLPLKDKSVIVISNNEANRQMLSNWLSYWGMRIKTCESTINHEQFDMIVSNELVILDLYGLQENAQLLLERLQTKNISQPDSVIVYGSKTQTLKLAKYFPEKNFLKTPFKALSLYSLLSDIYAIPPNSPEYKFKKITAQKEHSINILVADDDPALLKVLTTQLRNWGFIFDVVKDGYQVLYAVQQKNYHVILIDLFMPGMDGLEATRRIREILPGERQPIIIMLTADSQVDTQAEMVAAGVNTVLVKPIKGDVLKNTLAQINEQLGNSLVQPSTSPRQALAPNLLNVIDQEILLDFHQALGLESKQALSELINSYLENTPKLLVDMDRALRINDWDQLKWAAHALKGNSELFGARNLSQLCQKLVADITHNILDNVTIQTRMIDNEYERVCEVLESLRENISRNSLNMIID
jgi:CheY-like chemotaxis protein